MALSRHPPSPTPQFLSFTDPAFPHPQAEEDRVASARAEVTKRIKALGTQGKVKDAISALAGLANLGIQPDTRAATALVQACTRDMELAQSIFDEMFGEQGAPSQAYND